MQFNISFINYKFITMDKIEYIGQKTSTVFLSTSKIKFNKKTARITIPLFLLGCLNFVKSLNFLVR